jgi:hypothetical protein
MTGKDPHLKAWAIEQLQATQARSDHSVHDLGLPDEEPFPGAGGVTFESEDNRQGRRALLLTARPVLLGQVELLVELTTQAPGRARPHRKLANLAATPEALRQLAYTLLDAADEADRNKPRPKPVR